MLTLSAWETDIQPLCAMWRLTKLNALMTEGGDGTRANTASILISGDSARLVASCLMRKLRTRSTQSKGVSEETEPGAAQFQHFISSHTARERGEAQRLSRTKPQLYDQGFGSSAKALIQERVYLSMLFLLKTGEWFSFFLPIRKHSIFYR